MIIDLRQSIDMPSLAPIPGTWSTWLATYSTRETAASKSPGTIKLRSYHLRRFALSTRLEPTDVTPEDIEQHLANPDWHPAYRRSVLGSLRSFFRWARRAGLIVIDPAEDSPSIRVPASLPRPASDLAIHAGLHAADERVRLMTRLGNEAGMRCCEICRVHSDDVSGPIGRRSILVHGKGGKQRMVPISDALALILLTPRGFVFPGQIDGHLSASYVSKLISRAMSGTGTAHPLRHRAATDWLGSSGGNLRVVQELLGHSSVATTQVYTFVQDDHLRRAVTDRAA